MSSRDPAHDLDALLEWVEDRIDSSENPATTHILEAIRDALLRNRRLEEQVAALREDLRALRSRSGEVGSGEPADAPATDGRRAGDT